MVAETGRVGQVRLDVLATSLVDDLASFCVADVRRAVAIGYQVAANVVYAFAEHDLDHVQSFVEHDNFEHLTTARHPHFDLFIVHMATFLPLSMPQRPARRLSVPANRSRSTRMALVAGTWAQGRGSKLSYHDRGDPHDTAGCTALRLPSCQGPRACATLLRGPAWLSPQTGDSRRRCLRVRQ